MKVRMTKAEYAAGMRAGGREAESRRICGGLRRW